MSENYKILNSGTELLTGNIVCVKIRALFLLEKLHTVKEKKTSVISFTTF